MNSEQLSDYSASRLSGLQPACGAEAYTALDRHARIESAPRLRGLAIILLAACAGFFSCGFVVFFATAVTNGSVLAGILTAAAGAGVVLCLFGALAATMPRNSMEA